MELVESQFQTTADLHDKQFAYVLLIIGIGALVYLNSFEGSFIFDDKLFVNENIQSLRQAMFAPGNISRPFIGLTLGINYAISGYEEWSYHLLNLLVHMCAALCLYGIVRRTLLTHKLCETFGERSAILALIIALLWMVHPLQTQAVTYIIQRCESIMGLFYLLTLYCAIRCFASQRKPLWYAAAFAACAGGMLSKQVMVTAPLMVLLYDYLFISPSLKHIWQQRKGFYFGLAATWCLLVATLIASPVNDTAGFAVKTISPFEYYLSEFRVIVQYIKLAFYPLDLSLDYGWKKATGMGEILPFAIPILLLQAATFWGIYRRKPQAFLGAWFFGILALTSSFMPFSDLVFEHRMYLPLAAIVSGVVLGADWLAARLAKQFGVDLAQRQARLLALVSVTLLVVSLGLLSVRRNMDYKSELVMWADNVNKRPESPRAQINLGKFLLEKGLNEKAIIHITEGLKYEPMYYEGHFNLGCALLNLGRAEEAKEHFQIAVAQRPDPLAHHYLGGALLESGEYDQAIEQFFKAIELRLINPETYFLLGSAFEKKGKLEEALQCFNKTLQVDANFVEALNEKALLLITNQNPKIRNPQEAIVCAEQAVERSKGQYGKSLDVLGRVYAEVGRYPEAVDAARQATLSLLAKTNKKFAEDSTAHLNSYLEKTKGTAAHP
jgi:tetratricopeptide (TPR) repeat protein